MKKNIKKIIPAIMITSMLATSAVFAQNSVVINSKSDEVKAEVISAPSEIVENIETKISVKLIKEGENLLFPVRDVFEQLGFEVGYEPVGKIITLTKGAQYVTFSTTEDAYTFARMAPQKLNQAPIVKDGSTYVPVTLLTDIMQMEGVSVDDEALVLSISTQSNQVDEIEDSEATLPSIKQTIIKEVDEENNTITVQDSKRGDIVLNIKDLEVEYTTDMKVLAVGQAVEVEYGDIMTASQPPMNTPKSLKVVQKYNIVEVLEVSEADDKGNTRVLVKEPEMGEVALIVSKDTKMNNIKDIKKGQILKVAMSDAMTMSIPPQTVAKEITEISLEKDEAQESTDEEKAEVSKVEVISVDKENGTVTVKDEKIGEVVLNISDDVKVEYEGAAEGTLHAWNWMEKGQKLEVVYGPVMTRSLPPINNPIKITALQAK